MAKTARDMLAEALAEVETVSVEQARRMHQDGDAVFVDVRDAVELMQGGTIPDAVHASRGLLEFQIDPQSPMHNPTFASGRRIVFFCGSGGRSALAAKTARDMGLTDVCHMAGGFGAWVAAAGPVQKD